MTDIETSNSLADLAARIKNEHQAVSAALTESVGHAIAAGELLIEAKDQVKHGEWLPWLSDHCTMSERTAQLYMRCAKNRTAIEEQIRNGVADLSLNEAAALLMLTSDVRKVFNFAREMEHLSSDELVERCITDDYAVIQSPGYDPFAGRNDAEKLEWHLFITFLCYDADAGRDGMNPEHASLHVEYLLQLPLQNVAEWLGEEGEKWRGLYGTSVSEEFKTDWAAFRDQHRECTQADVKEMLNSLQRAFDEAKAAGRLEPRKRKRARRG
jgi:hypothetical protein